MVRIENLRNLPVCRRGRKQVLYRIEGQAGVGQLARAARRNPQFNGTSRQKRQHLILAPLCD